MVFFDIDETLLNYAAAERADRSNFLICTKAGMRPSNCWHMGDNFKVDFDEKI